MRHGNETVLDDAEIDDTQQFAPENTAVNKNANIMYE
jgi:hypothetical protein